ncbi:hypothetical protein KSP39_PZI000290 [Platanthera zijinensis]|uniref:Uncharacterized protein n=1 Tax=Platanthera zijinensis TaxID=2320716 RepID=A0AAP0GFV2_9ASPA
MQEGERAKWRKTKDLPNFFRRFIRLLQIPAFPRKEKVFCRRFTPKSIYTDIYTWWKVCQFLSRPYFFFQHCIIVHNSTKETEFLILMKLINV